MVEAAVGTIEPEFMRRKVRTRSAASTRCSNVGGGSTPTVAHVSVIHSEWSRSHHRVILRPSIPVPPQTPGTLAPTRVAKKPCGAWPKRHFSRRHLLQVPRRRRVEPVARFRTPTRPHRGLRRPGRGEGPYGGSPNRAPCRGFLSRWSRRQSIRKDRTREGIVRTEYRQQNGPGPQIDLIWEPSDLAISYSPSGSVGAPGYRIVKTNVSESAFLNTRLQDCCSPDRLQAIHHADYVVTPNHHFHSAPSGILE